MKCFIHRWELQLIRRDVLVDVDTDKDTGVIIIYKEICNKCLLSERGPFILEIRLDSTKKHGCEVSFFRPISEIRPPSRKDIKEDWK